MCRWCGWPDARSRDCGQIASRRSVNLIKDLKQQLARAKRAKEEVQQRCDTLESQLAEAKAQRDLQQPPQARGERFSGAEVARSASSPNVREAAANERPASAGAVDAAGSSAGGARTAQAHSGKEREIIQALAHRLEALLQENAAVREKVAFLERNGHLLAEDLEEKKRLLAQFTSADKVGGVPLARRGGSGGGRCAERGTSMGRVSITLTRARCPPLSSPCPMATCRTLIRTRRRRWRRRRGRSPPQWPTACSAPHWPKTPASRCVGRTGVLPTHEVLVCADPSPAFPAQTDLKLLGEQTMALKDLLREQENGS